MSAKQVDAPATQFYERLIRSIAEPEPMCLVLISFRLNDWNADPNIHDSSDKLTTEIADAVESRLATNLRKYDSLSQVEKRTFAVALKTMVGESELIDRLKQFETKLTEPYIVEETDIGVSIRFGYAFRIPGESPASLINRADEKAAQNDVPAAMYTQ